jgi:putative colanic acid biosynthesis UDP-glucose lipid carrier transferase
MTRQANALLIIIVGFLVAYWLRFGYTALTQGYLLALLVCLVLASVVLPATGAFRREFEWELLRRMRRLVAGWAVVLLMLVSIAAMTKTTDYFSRIWFGLWTILSTVGLVAVLLMSHYASIRRRNQNRQTRPVALVGTGEAAARLEEQILHDSASDMTIAQRFGKPWSSAPVMPLSELAGYIEDNNIRAVWIAVAWEDKSTLNETLAALRESVVDVNVVPDLHQYRLLNQSVSEWAGLPVISLAGTPMTDAELRLKAVMDWLGALLLVILLSPLFLLISALILITDGRPVLYKQQRHGIGGESIGTFKFRTMRNGSQDEAFRQASPDDERVTAVGKFLRKTSLDELPQLFNVLKGEMSLVGPRPHPLELNQEFKSRIPRYMLRHKVKPGITGWAQVNGYRGQTETREKMALRIEHDLWYIQNWSLWLDLKILLMTPFVLIHQNAY